MITSKELESKSEEELFSLFVKIILEVTPKLFESVIDELMKK